ncbi:MAG: helix-turn-helix transcriptional regulator [Actinomycetia bacterium]|nr:helix-turn-helix transcriptional regulator [Actinomycetes bacterium]
MLTFRNVDADPEASPTTWPFEAKVTAVERGTLADYRRILDACRADPATRQAFLEACDVLGNTDGAAVVRLGIEGLSREEHRRLAVIDMQLAVERSGLTLREAAERIGTSASRLSTYLTGSVVPGADRYLQILALPGRQDRSASR